MSMISLLKKKTFYGLRGRYLTVSTILKIKLPANEISICFHNFHRGDEDPDTHDHPFSFVSLVLAGGYREFGEDGRSIVRKPFSLAYRTATHRHRVEPLTNRCWTICLKRKVDRVWGFWQDGNFIPWKDYIRSKGLEPVDNAA
jgi:hypothetical protein